MKTYATKANAARAARKAVGGTDGEEFMTYQLEDGKWSWQVEQGPTAIEPPKAEPTAPVAPPAEPEDKVVPVEAPTTKQPRDKGAVRRVWDICDDHKDMRRKDVIQLCVDKGINYYTARTQYQAWFKATNDSNGNGK